MQRTLEPGHLLQLPTVQVGKLRPREGKDCQGHTGSWQLLLPLSWGLAGHQPYPVLIFPVTWVSGLAESSEALAGLSLGAVDPRGWGGGGINLPRLKATRGSHQTRRPGACEPLSLRPRH